MKRRGTTLGLLALCALAAHQGSLAQPKELPRRIGFLGFSNPIAGKAYLDAFNDELAKLGWVEGRNVVSEYRWADADATRLDALAADLVALKPSLIFTPNAPGALALQRTTRTIPIVFAGVVDPVALGLVKSLSHPGANLTGTASDAGSEIVGKRLQILKEWFPHLSRLAVAYNRLEQNDTDELVKLRRFATQLDIKLEEFDMRNLVDIDLAIASLQRSRADAIYIIGGAVTYTNRQAICRRLIAARLPSTSNSTPFAEAGCLIAYAARLEEFAKEGARYVDQILRGLSPADLPIRQPTKYELVINATTASALSLTIPKTLLLSADQVIK